MYISTVFVHTYDNYSCECLTYLCMYVPSEYGIVRIDVPLDVNTSH